MTGISGRVSPMKVPKQATATRSRTRGPFWLLGVALLLMVGLSGCKKTSAWLGGCAKRDPVTSDPSPKGPPPKGSLSASGSPEAGEPALAGAPAVTRYRAAAMDPRVQEIPGDLLANVFEDPEGYIEAVVDTLVYDIDDELLIVKRLHDWIAEHIAYDVDAYYGTIPRGSQGWIETLRTRRSVCEGYARLLVRMCDLAGVECIKISGYGRGIGFDLFEEGRPERSNHAWNAVRVDGKWHLLDGTWDAGHVKNKRFVPRYSTDYLYLDPQDFLHTHLPDDSRWQLLDEPLDTEAFLDLPPLKGGFFAHGLAFESSIARRNAIGDWMVLGVQRPAGVDVMAKLYNAQGVEHPERTFLQPDGPRVVLHARFPEAGRWSLKLFAKSSSETIYNDVGTLGFRADTATDLGFPRIFADYHRLGAVLSGPLIERLPRDRAVDFKVRVPGAHKVQLVSADERWFPLARDGSEEDLWTMKLHVKVRGPYRLMANVDKGSTRYVGLVAFD